MDLGILLYNKIARRVTVEVSNNALSRLRLNSTILSDITGTISQCI